VSILIDQNTICLIQGITGKEGSRVAANMASYGTKVVAGVTPGKGGQEVEGVRVYNTVAEALAKHPDINTTGVYVPPFAVLSAVREALQSKIPLIHIIAEHVPIKDTALIIAEAKKNQARVVGPSSIGLISPGQAKVGSIGGADADRAFGPGKIGVLSKSGGMASEVSWLLKKNGFGQSTVVGIGGDVLVGSSFADLLELFAQDSETEAVVLVGEFGGTYEEDAADFIQKSKFSKPVVAFISGLFAEGLPQGIALGHAGAIIEGGKGTRKGKVEALEKAGVSIAHIPTEIPEILKEKFAH
jgi:succinyl-CoA synthetase alpha subunit